MSDSFPLCTGKRQFGHRSDVVTADGVAFEGEGLHHTVNIGGKARLLVATLRDQLFNCLSAQS